MNCFDYHRDISIHWEIKRLEWPVRKSAHEVNTAGSDNPQIILSQSVWSIRFTATMDMGTFHLWGGIELSRLESILDKWGVKIIAITFPSSCCYHNWTLINSFDTHRQYKNKLRYCLFEVFSIFQTWRHEYRGSMASNLPGLKESLLYRLESWFIWGALMRKAGHTDDDVGGVFIFNSCPLHSCIS